MRNGLKKGMLWLTLATAALMLFCRLAAVPLGWLPQIFADAPGFWTALAGCVMMAVTLVLCLICRSPATTVDHRQLASVSTVSILSGAALLMSTAFEIYLWVTTRQTPAPNDIILSTMDGVLLTLMWVFGVLGGAFLVWLGFFWLTRYVSYHGRMRLWALTPTIWAWTRLARYVVSYTGTSNVTKTLEDLLMLVFSMLFLFSFARYVGAVGRERKRRPLLLFYACGAFLFSLTAAVTRLVGYWQPTLASSSARMVGAADLALGLLALAVAIAVAYTRRTETVFERVRAEHPEWLPEDVADGIDEMVEDAPAEAPEMPADAPAQTTDAPAQTTDAPVQTTDAPVDPAPETPRPTAPETPKPISVDDILNEIYQDKP